MAVIMVLFRDGRDQAIDDLLIGSGGAPSMFQP